ncbi:MAG TPA: acyl carrier protein [Euzebya sp.]|nr:acyl carrier protein [Euzebya sp.]
MTAEADIEQTVVRFVTEEFGSRRPGVDIGPEDDLIEQGIMDSVGVFRLVAFLEDTFDLAVPPAAIVPQNLGSIGAIQRYVARTIQTP